MRAACLVIAALAASLFAAPAWAENSLEPVNAIELLLADPPAKGAKECACENKYRSPGRAVEYYQRAVRYVESDPRTALIWARVALQYDPAHNDARRLKHELEAQGITLKDD